MKKNILKSIIASTLVASMLLGGTVSASVVDTNTNTNVGTTTAPTSHWTLNNGKWSYVLEDGTQAKGWKQVNNKWYYFESDGTMATGWHQEGAIWYYLNKDGDMAIGWLKDNGNWYYTDWAGRRICNAWIGNYYVNYTGEMTVDDYTCDGYWVDANGLWDGKPAKSLANIGNETLTGEGIIYNIGEEAKYPLWSHFGSILNIGGVPSNITKAQLDAISTPISDSYYTKWEHDKKAPDIGSLPLDDKVYSDAITDSDIKYVRYFKVLKKAYNSYGRYVTDCICIEFDSKGEMRTYYVFSFYK